MRTILLLNIAAAFLATAALDAQTAPDSKKKQVVATAPKPEGVAIPEGLPSYTAVVESVVPGKLGEKGQFVLTHTYLKIRHVKQVPGKKPVLDDETDSAIAEPTEPFAPGDYVILKPMPYSQMMKLDEIVDGKQTRRFMVVSYVAVLLTKESMKEARMWDRLRRSNGPPPLILDRE